ncbi:MAG TPA: 3-dehydroquinate synthase family protein [Thermoanaerobaculaceae bacterium]|nr:3-dehydroquinate synthase family protein [Thermoanaerobaculaceae bacterium]
MITIDLELAGGRSPCHVGEGTLGELAELLRPFSDAGQAFVVTDTTVGPLYGIDVAEQLDAPLLELPTGEEHKRWQSVERVARWLIANQVERGGLLVAVGGGVVTDLVGFAAAIVLRGMPWVAVPTTLLGMVDAALGGKTGIDLDVGKNLVGAFWPPRAVIADPLVLATLDLRQLRSGLAEVVKSAMIAPSTLEHILDSHLGPVAAGDPMQAIELVVGCIRVKSEIVAVDEREAGPRRALNLGHTLAHGLEGATDFSRFLHGEAVTWGLLAELRLARDRGLLSTAEAVTWAERLQALAPLPDLRGIAWEAVAPYIERDKKRLGGRVGWVLPRMGGVVLDVAVTDDEAAAVYALLQELPPAGPFTTLI